MKNLVKIAAVAVLSLGFGVAAQAQGTPPPIATGEGSAQLDASANVLASIDVEKSGELAFGQVMPGFKKYVPMIDGNENVQSNSRGAVNKVGVSSGLFKVFAADGSSVLLTLEFSGLKKGADELEVLWNEDLAGPQTTIAYLNAADEEVELEIGENPIIFPDRDDTDESGATRNGTIIYVGATVNPAADQAPGQYTGILTLTANYN